MKRYFSSVAATEVSTPGVLAGGNEGAERSEATPENETNAEMGPPPLTSNNPPSISTRESTSFVSHTLFLKFLACFYLFCCIIKN